MILLDDFIIDLKRVNQYGDESVVNDSPTTDLIRWIINTEELLLN